jgi:23S rRNA (guanosine2251-2'-O)-methyltransferase
VLIADTAKTTQGMREVLNAARDAGVSVRGVSRGELDGLAEDHQGVVAYLGTAASLSTLTERDLSVFPFEEQAIVVVLDGITDPQNLGAAARSAEGAGAALLVTRTKRAADTTPAAIRSSAGALLHLPHARVANIPRAIDRLKGAGFFVVGLAEEADRSIYDEPCPTGRVAVVIGNEGVGMSRLVREHCDSLVALPMRGKVHSLNASASLAAALFAYVLPTHPRSSG